MFELYSHVSEYVLRQVHRLPGVPFSHVNERPSKEEDDERPLGVSNYVLKQIYRLPGFPTNPAYERLADVDHDEGGYHERGGEHVEGHFRRLFNYAYRIRLYIFCSLLVLLLCFIGRVITHVYSYYL